MLIQALLWSRFLISISLIMLLVTTLFVPKSSKNAPEKTWHEWFLHYLMLWNWRFAPPQSALKNSKNKEKWLFWLSLTLPFAIVLVSGLWSEDVGYWFTRLKIRLPFLILPVVFWFLPPLNSAWLRAFLSFFVAVIALNIFVVEINYGLNFSRLTDMLGQGRPLPFLKDHITFSIMAAVAFFSAIFLFLEKKESHDADVLNGTTSNQIIPPLSILSYFWAFLAVFLFIGIHVIAVRTGIFSLYIALIISVLYFIFKTKKILVGALALSMVAALPFLAYKTIPSLERRISYALWDLEQFKQNNLAKKSDSERIISLQMGVEVVQKSLIFGVGFGDVMNEVSAVYAQKYPNLDVREPHSSIIFTWASVGIMGLGLFLASFVLPLAFVQRFWLLPIFLTLIFCGNTVDFVIEGSMGASFHALFLTLFLSHCFVRNNK